jgi:hypothetical protein
MALIGKFEIELRHRPILSQSIDKKNREFLDLVGKLDGVWKARDVERFYMSEVSDNLTTTILLRNAFGKGIKAHLTYQLRSEKYLMDNAQYDDVFFAEFDSGKVDFMSVALDFIPYFVRSFDAYRAAIRDVDIALEDWQYILNKIRETGKDVDGRDGVYRFHAVNYWDRELCQRAFQKTPEEIVRRLSGLVIKAEVMNGGAYIICCDSFPSHAMSTEINDKIRMALQ